MSYHYQIRRVFSSFQSARVFSSSFVASNNTPQRRAPPAAPPPRSMADARERGNALYKSGKFADAVRAYDESLAASPSAAAHANKAAALAAQGRKNIPAAVQSCVAALCLDPAYERAKTRLGALLTKLGDLDVASAAARERANAGAPGARAIATQLETLRDGRREGNVLFKAGNFAAARAKYTAALDAAAAIAAKETAEGNENPPESPPSPPPGAALLLCNRAACASALGDFAAGSPTPTRRRRRPGLPQGRAPASARAEGPGAPRRRRDRVRVVTERPPGRRPGRGGPQRRASPAARGGLPRR